MAFFKKDSGEINQKTLQSLESEQKEMIRGIVELPGITVREVMIPRIDTVFLRASASKQEIISAISESGHSRFPVYEENIDDVIGILYAKDLLTYLVQNDEFNVKRLLRPPFFVPESKHIDDLLRELQHKKVHIAVVVDEYGGVSGIVCMEDIIEEIVGDIQDEFDHETEDIVKVDECTFLCDARANLEDLAEETGIAFPVDDFDTLGGFVFDIFGKIPAQYEKAVFNGVDFIIEEMEGHKIQKVRITTEK
ncbi:MAG: hemolysin family protein [Treponema sp.]|jgi:CBS domain containing-hemolysin-like protein|nr:hemolysin family protein [Treponema sp.]